MFMMTLLLVPEVEDASRVRGAGVDGYRCKMLAHGRSRNVPMTARHEIVESLVDV
jgi:hypothetical protein